MAVENNPMLAACEVLGSALGTAPAGLPFCPDLRCHTESKNQRKEEQTMAVVGTVHRHGNLTGVKADAATKLPEQVSVYLAFRNSDDEQENVEISFQEAAFLHGWLANILK